MKKPIFFILLSFLLFIYPLSIKAQSNPPFDCNFSVTPRDAKGVPRPQLSSTEILNDFEQLTLNFDLNSIPKETWNQFPDADLDGQPDFFQKKLILDWNPDTPIFTCLYAFDPGKFTTSSNNVGYTAADLGFTGLEKTYCRLKELNKPHPVVLRYINNTGKEKELCRSSLKVQESEKPDADIIIASDNGLYDVNSKWVVTIKNVKVPLSWNLKLRQLYIYLDGQAIPKVNSDKELFAGGTLDEPMGATIDKSLSSPYIHFVLKPIEVLGPHHVTVKTVGNYYIKEQSFRVLKRGEPTPTTMPTPTPISPFCQQCKDSNDCLDACNACPQCPGGKEISEPTKNLLLCQQIDPKYFDDCWTNCQADGKHVWTAIGCLPTDFGLLLKYVFKYGTGIAGGVAFLYFLYGIFLVLTSAGNAEQIEQAKQTIMSAISGLLLIIFSVFLLRVIGVDILKIPGFGA